MASDIEDDVDAMIPVHSEAVPGDDRSVRWSIPPGTLDFVGRPAGLPAPLQDLLDRGTLEAVAVEPTGVHTRLGEGLAWRTSGPAVRSAVQHALAAPGEWVPPPGATADDVLRMAARTVIDGQVGDYIRSHGGAIEIVDVVEGRVSVAMSGTCSHCPASNVTLTQRFEVALRELYPRLVGVSAAPGSSPSQGRPLFGLSGLRRRVDTARDHPGKFSS